MMSLASATRFTSSYPVVGSAGFTDRASGEVHRVDGFCEVRWSHGKLQGMPECKVQVRTPLAELPGYDPMT